jgi:hypothetical protein
LTDEDERYRAKPAWFSQFELENQARHHQASERMTRLEGGLSHMPAQLDTLGNMVAELAKEIRTRPAQPATGTELVAYSAAEAAKSWARFAPQSSNNGPLWAALGALLVIVALLAWKAFAG